MQYENGMVIISGLGNADNFANWIDLRCVR